jgi:hypothetical protein
MTDCSICCEKINNSRRKLITCPSCNFEVCLVCFKRYLLESVKQTPDCMSCHNNLTFDFLTQYTPNSFYNGEYRTKRAKNLLSTEKSLLPDTQHLVEEEKRKNKLREELNKLKIKEKALKNELKHIKLLISETERSFYERPLERTERKKFVMRCPAEDCRGFLSQQYKCGTCEKYACPKCHKLKNGKNDEEHVCNEDDIATAELLNKDTKPCPKCSVPIFKISGCDLMWCVSCHVTFSWNKNEIVHVSNNHNPHYYQWQRENNNGVVARDPNDIPPQCGRRLPSIHTIRRILREKGEVFPDMEMCHRMIGHINDVLIPLYPTNYRQNDHSDLRVQFLLKHIDENYWEKELKKRQKRQEKNQEMNMILNMLVTVLTDYFTRYANGELDNLSGEIEALRVYVNEQLYKITKHYKNNSYRITKTWQIK